MAAGHAGAAKHAVVRGSGLLGRLWGLAATVLSVLWTVLVAPVTAVASLFRNGHPASALSRLWAWLIIAMCGVKVEIEGLENIAGLKSYVLVANHQSYFDIFALLARMPGEPRFVAKKELLRIPVIGFALKHSGHIMIDRRRGGQAIRRAIEATRQGYWICVFPEGTRFSDNRVHEFSDGAGWLAIATRLPCVPMAISGSGAIFPRGAWIVVPRRRIKMAIGKPVETAELRSADRAALTKRLEEAVRAAFIPDLLA